MTSETRRTAGRPGYIVFREVRAGEWELMGEADRRPGSTARQARARAVQDVTGGRAAEGEVYAAVLRSEWRIALDY